MAKLEKDLLMYYYFEQFSEATKFIFDFNKDKDKVDNQPKAKIVAWPHTQTKGDREWIVFSPKMI